MRRIYLDYAASTPVEPRVVQAMRPYFTEKFGNPGSLHSFGQEAIAAVDRSREFIAASIGAGFREVVFTGSATEANNLALRGAVQKFKEKDPDVANPRVIISAIEHESVLEAARELEREGIEVVYLPVAKRGIVDMETLKKSLNDKTMLVSVMYANNEIGSVQPIVEIAEAIKEFKKSAGLKKGLYLGYPLFHTDAAQAFQFFDCNVSMLGVDLMTLSSHKIYGPKGVGALYIKSDTEIEPLFFGGGQEFGVQSGTENVPAIVGFSKAVELISRDRASENKKIEALKDYFWKEIKKIFPKAESNGGTDKKSGVSLPNILSVHFPGKAAQDLLTRFDLNGLAASSGSACRSRAMESSHVIEALGYPKSRARESVRFSLGRPTTRQELSMALKAIKRSLS